MNQIMQRFGLHVTNKIYVERSEKA